MAACRTGAPRQDSRRAGEAGGVGDRGGDGTADRVGRRGAAGAACRPPSLDGGGRPDPARGAWAHAGRRRRRRGAPWSLGGPGRRAGRPAGLTAAQPPAGVVVGGVPGGRGSGADPRRALAGGGDRPGRTPGDARGHAVRGQAAGRRRVAAVRPGPRPDAGRHPAPSACLGTAPAGPADVLAHRPGGRAGTGWPVGAPGHGRDSLPGPAGQPRVHGPAGPEPDRHRLRRPGRQRRGRRRARRGRRTAAAGRVGHRGGAPLHPHHRGRTGPGATSCR
jgi:hypothetical protein